jgi:hypothetical protein
VIQSVVIFAGIANKRLLIFCCGKKCVICDMKYACRCCYKGNGRNRLSRFKVSAFKVTDKGKGTDEGPTLCMQRERENGFTD